MEIVEDTETEPESVDTDPDERETSKQAATPTSPKKELVSILKRNNSSETNQKELSDLLDEVLDGSPTCYLQKANLPIVTLTTPQVVKTRTDTQSVAEYLILDDGTSEEVKTSVLERTKNEEVNSGARRRMPSVKEVTFQEKGSPVAKRTRVQRFITSTGEVREDCDSFYGSDKETDDALIFSDDTEIDVGSSSSEEGDGKRDDAIDKVDFREMVWFGVAC